jgi:hypothetical protein
MAYPSTVIAAKGAGHGAEDLALGILGDPAARPSIHARRPRVAMSDPMLSAS